ncbi:hypothetical protein acdb102_21160 [Acidothermaceae bacterium B102]|nr:hypothetical protein acdb102_21160 [Acidothermaceae bacterium B102]
MTPRSSFRALAATAVTSAVLTGCGSSAPALGATGPRAFTYDIVHRTLAGPTFAKSDKTTLLSLGQAMCGALDKGHTVSQLNDGLLATKSLGATADEDGRFVTTVVVTLCPKYVSQFTAAASPAPKSPAG